MVEIDKDDILFTDWEKWIRAGAQFNIKEQERRTFNDVLVIQRKTLEIINDCIDKNRVLTKEEKEKLFEWLPYSCLSYGTKTVIFNAPPGTLDNQQHVYKGMLTLGNLSQAYDFLQSQTLTLIKVPTPIPGNFVILNIRDVWIGFKKHIIKLFPFALDVAFLHSKEF
jgi:hypothetical protein